MKKLIALVLVGSLSACAAGPQLVIDPQSITDSKKYVSDLNACTEIAKGYSAGAATAGSAALGAGAAVVGAGLVLATGGLILLPVGIIAAGAGGAAAGGGLAHGKQSRARENIEAQCMTERGYKAYRP